MSFLFRNLPTPVIPIHSLARPHSFQHHRQPTLLSSLLPTRLSIPQPPPPLPLPRHRRCDCYRLLLEQRRRPPRQRQLSSSPRSRWSRPPGTAKRNRAGARTTSRRWPASTRSSIRRTRIHTCGTRRGRSAHADRYQNPRTRTPNVRRAPMVGLLPSASPFIDRGDKGGEGYGLLVAGRWLLVAGCR